MTPYGEDNWCRNVPTVTGTTATRLFLDAQEPVAPSVADHQCVSAATGGRHVARVDDAHILYGVPAVTYVFARQ
ncbi:hypothetical protein [Streptomyces yanii]|uniref:Uncharacterized protein n=1 Tax=Streptomyces yanii TaxID=78510 RepID=A0ABV5RKI7_9ACTN